MKLRISIALLLVACMLATMLVGCGNGDKKDPVTDPVTEPVTEPTIDPNTLSLAEKFGTKDYNGTTITFLTGGDSNWWVNYDIKGPVESGEILSEALYKRNADIMDTFDVTIVHEQKTHTAAGNAVKKDVTAMDNYYDAYFANGNQLSKLVTNQLATNLNDVEGFNFDDPWWTSTVNKDLNFGGEYRPFAMGDMNVMAWKTTALIMYNYTLGKNEGVEDCFQLVRDNKWTMDKWNQLSRDFALDYDLDGSLNWDKDRYGVVCGNQSFEYSLNGMMETLTSADATGWPTIFTLSERSVNAFEKITEHYSKLNTLNVHDSSYSGGTSLAGKSAKLFAEGRFLFFSETIGGSFQLWDMEDDYGFLPFPKYDETQENYNSSIQSAQMSIVTIPTLAEARLTETVDVINAMGYLNMKDVKDIFFNAVFGTRSVRDDNSLEMLKIVLQDRTFDLGVCLNFGNLYSELRKTAIAGTNAFASTYESFFSAAQDACGNFVEALQQ